MRNLKLPFNDPISFNVLKTKLTTNDIEQILTIIGHRCREKTIKRLRSILTYGTSTIEYFGIFERLTRDSTGWEYCAGQSYNDEIRTLRELILKGN